jgi:hypothetical protein
VLRLLRGDELKSHRSSFAKKAALFLVPREPSLPPKPVTAAPSSADSVFFQPPFKDSSPLCRLSSCLVTAPLENEHEDVPDCIDGGGGARDDDVSVRAIRWGPKPSVRSDTHLRVTLKDGSRLYGTIEQEDDTSIVFRSVAGVVITAPRADVQSLRAANWSSTRS